MYFPSRYKAQDIQGKVVEGYFVMLNVPIFGDHGDVIAFRQVPHIFNDSPGVREKGCYWHEIRFDTLREIKSVVQLDLFD